MEEKTFAPDFWNDPKKAEQIMREVNAEKSWVNEYAKAETLVEDLEVLYEFYKEDEASAEDVQKKNDDALDLIALPPRQTVAHVL